MSGQESSENSRSRPRPATPIDTARLDRLALDYVARYATTSLKLQHYLSRKIMQARQSGTLDEAAAQALGDHAAQIIARFAERGYVNDRAWAEMKASALRASGYGERRVRETLRHNGIESAVVDEIGLAPDEEGNMDPRFEIALRFARRHRIGPFSRTHQDEQKINRDIARLMRAGHPYDIARKIATMAATDIDVSA